MRPTNISITSFKDGHWTAKGEFDLTLKEICCPDCGRIASCSNHQITMESDNTLTFVPSLVCPHPGCGNHIFINHNAIQYLNAALPIERDSATLASVGVIAPVAPAPVVAVSPPPVRPEFAPGSPEANGCVWSATNPRPIRFKSPAQPT